jgi:hypothetical protein
MRWVPFTAHVRIEPSYGSPDTKSKRLEYWRDMQKLSAMAYTRLISETSINIANPGGGQQTSASGFDHGGMGGMTPGTAVKPQIGQSPAQLMITGFHESDTPNLQPYPNSTIFQGGDVPLNPTELLAIQGPGAHSWDSVPVATVLNGVTELKNLLIVALTDAFPVGTVFSIFRIDYSGIIYGDRGYTFPR